MKRPHMSEAVKRAAIFRNMHANGGHLVCEETSERLTEADLLNGRVHIDHNPPLALRYRDEYGNYRPPANDLSHLDVVSAAGHIFRTAKRRGLYHGDQTQIAKSRRMVAARLGTKPKKQSRLAWTNKRRKEIKAERAERDTQ